MSQELRCPTCPEPTLLVWIDVAQIPQGWYQCSENHQFRLEGGRLQAVKID